MAKYTIYHNKNKVGPKGIEAYEIKVEGNAIKFRNSAGNVIAVYSVKHFHVIKE